MTTRIALLVFDHVDLLDVGGPYEVFLTANRLRERAGEPAPFEVTVVGTSSTVTAFGGLGLVPTHGIDEAGAIDVVVVPGAVDMDTVLADDAVREAVRRLAGTADVTASVCTGALLLATVGLLDDVAAATTHHEDVPILADTIGDRAVTARWADAGHVVTAGGLSSGIGMALHLVERLADRNLAVATAAQIEYQWDPDDGVTT